MRNIEKYYFFESKVPRLTSLIAEMETKIEFVVF